MSAAAPAVIPFGDAERLAEARRLVLAAAETLRAAAGELDAGFLAAVDAVDRCDGTVFVTGVGKAGLIGAKLAATLSSLGVPSRTLHPVDAVHGDLGGVGPGDVVVALSNSGETEELTRLLPPVAEFGATVVALTATGRNTLARLADVIVPFGEHRELDPHGLAPTASTTAMLAVGDALAVTVAARRGFTPRDFAAFHPGGSLGRKLRSVRDVMRTGDDLRIADENTAARDTLARVARPGRRTGALMLVDGQGVLTGLFTDSDLARLLERRDDVKLDGPIAAVMTPAPVTISADDSVERARETLAARHLSELPVVDRRGRPVGLVDVTDLIGLGPGSAA